MTLDGHICHFSFMAENMVFMMITAMLKNFYLYLIRNISDKVKPLKKTSRLLSSLSITRRGKKTSQYTKSSHKKKCCGIKVKQEILSLVDSEIQKIKNDPMLSNLIKG